MPTTSAAAARAGRASELAGMEGANPASATTAPRVGGPAASRIDRGCPVDTARYRCLWHAGGTADGGDLAQARQPWSLARPQGNPGVVTVSGCAWWQDGTRWSLRLAGVGGRRGRLDAGEGTRADAGQEGPRR